VPNKLLSILIPTHNRADFLDYSLEIHMPLAKKHNIQIFIFDNASTDNTEEIVHKWQKEYPDLIYHRHKTNIGGVGNFEYALQYPTTEYVWLLGDTYQIEDGVINYVLEVLGNTPNKYDALVLNLSGTLKIPTKDYNNSNLLLYDLGALMTCIAVSIIKKDIVKDEILKRYRSVWFTHTAVIFEDIANRVFCVHWAQGKSITGLKNSNLRKINWSHTSKAFEIGCKDWSNFVFSLPPSYDINSKMKCIMDFGKVSGLFTLSSLIKLKLKGILNFKVFLQYKKLFVFTIDYPSLLIFLLVFLPRLVLIFFGIIGIIVLKRDKIKKISLLLKEI
jgi:abequosyltransferase